MRHRGELRVEIVVFESKWKSAAVVEIPPLMASFVRGVRRKRSTLVLDGTRRFLIEAFCVRGRVHECRRFPKHARCPDEILESDTGMCAYGRLPINSTENLQMKTWIVSRSKEAVMAAFEWKVPIFASVRFRVE